MTLDLMTVEMKLTEMKSYILANLGLLAVKN